MSVALPMVAQTQLPEDMRVAARYSRRAARDLDRMVERLTAAAIRDFLSRRIPGVEYDLDSRVDEGGKLVLTYTPRTA